MESVIKKRELLSMRKDTLALLESEHFYTLCEKVSIAINSDKIYGNCQKYWNNIVRSLKKYKIFYNVERISGFYESFLQFLFQLCNILLMLQVYEWWCYVTFQLTKREMFHNGIETFRKFCKIYVFCNNLKVLVIFVAVTVTDCH